jgi:flagellar protein FlgJ
MSSFGILSAQPSASTVPEIAKRSNAGSKEKMRATAEDYEAVYLNTMLSQMFTGLPTDGMFHGGAAEETWRGMLVEEYSKSIAKSGALGVADAIYSDMLRIQEAKTQ